MEDNENKIIKKSILNEDIEDCKKYYSLKDNLIYKIIIIKYKNSILIKSKTYEKNFELNELKKIINIKFDNIDTIYNFIINIFDENKVTIKNEIIKKRLILEMKIEEGKKFEIELIYNVNCKNIILSKLNDMQKEINILKKENEKLNKEIKLLKKYHDENNPNDIEFFNDLSEKANAYTNLDNSFAIFKSINNNLYLIHSNYEKSIISYDLINLNLISEIKNAHNAPISNLKYYFDEIVKRDLIMSISCDDNNIKIWNWKNWECILNLMGVNKTGDLYFATILRENNNNYIITSNRNKEGEPENIKIFNFKGEKIDELKNSNENTLFLDSYYDSILSKNFILTANFGHVKSYDFSKNELYHEYNDNDNRGHYSIIIKNIDNIIKLIESCTDGNIRIWNFHSGMLIIKIRGSDKGLRGICLWDDNFLFAGSDDKTFKLIDIKNKSVPKVFNGHDNKVITLKSIIHPKFGKCLITQAFQRDKIKIWKNRNILI